MKRRILTTLVILMLLCPGGFIWLKRKKNAAKEPEKKENGIKFIDIFRSLIQEHWSGMGFRKDLRFCSKS